MEVNKKLSRELMDQNNKKIIMDWRELLLYLGYDLQNHSDIDRLVKNADWINEKRLLDENKKRIRPGIIVTFITVAISSIVTLITTWHEWIPKK